MRKKTAASTSKTTTERRQGEDRRASEDRRVKILDADTIAERKVLHIQPDSIGGLAWSPDSKRLAVGCLDGTLALYKAAVEKEEAAPATPKADDQGVLLQQPWQGERHCHIWLTPLSSLHIVLIWGFPSVRHCWLSCRLFQTT